ncbi:unnamed protein product [Ixodes persulcatus]
MVTENDIMWLRPQTRATKNQPKRVRNAVRTRHSPVVLKF